MKLKTKLKIFAAIILLIWIGSCTATVYDKSVLLYNTNQQLVADYSQKTSEQISTYDANYLTFKQKSEVTAINKETFIAVTDIIMAGRKDGQGLAWKWVTENQPIPYTEFSSFYKDLSAFTEQQYGAMAAIEQQKQQLVKEQTLLIHKFPNNIYNRWLKIKPLQYKAGYISDQTKELFKTQ